MADVGTQAAMEAGKAAAQIAAPMMGGKRSKWLAHVKKTMKSHKGKSLKQVLKLAAKSYKSKGGSGPSYLSPMGVGQETGSLINGGRRTRRKSRKGGRKH